jgi:hypothetical protein
MEKASEESFFLMKKKITKKKEVKFISQKKEDINELYL